MTTGKTIALTRWTFVGKVLMKQYLGFSYDSVVKIHLPMQEMEFDPWVGKIPWRRKWQPTPVFLPGKFHGQMSLAGYTLKGHKELDMTEQLSTHNERISNVLPNILVAMVLFFFEPAN